MVLYLKCESYGIGLDLPTTPAVAADRISALREGIDGPVEIDGIGSPIPNLFPYIQHTDLESEVDIEKLNALAQRVHGMTEAEQHLFSGVLELERSGGLDDALRIANGLDQYEIFPKIITNEDLGRFLVDTSFMTGKFSFPEATRPYLDYGKIGAEQKDVLGGIYTPHGLVRRREEAQVQTEKPGTMTLTLMTTEQSDTLILPAFEEQLNQARSDLEIEDFSQAVVAGVEYVEPSLNHLVPTDGITVEDANEMALCLQRIKKDGEIMKYCAVLEVEEPPTFSEALDIAMDLDDYELVSDNEREYGREVLRRIGADDEIINTIDGYMDFAQLGTDSLVEDGVRRTEFGLVRRLSMPFPPGPEIGQTMM